MSRSRRSAPRRRSLALGLLAFGLAFACGGEKPSARTRGALETVDVAAPVDAGATTELDVVATPRAVSAGVLPGDFPKEVPLPVGGSLIDFGEGAAGSWIEMVVAAPPAEVESAYRGSLARARFREASGGVWSRGSLRLAVAVSARGAGATVRLEPLAR